MTPDELKKLDALHDRIIDAQIALSGVVADLDAIGFDLARLHMAGGRGRVTRDEHCEVCGKPYTPMTREEALDWLNLLEEDALLFNIEAAPICDSAECADAYVQKRWEGNHAR